MAELKTRACSREKCITGEFRQEKTQTDAKHVITVTDANLEEVTAKNELVVIDFWNERCEYCTELAPIVQRLATDYAGRVAFGKLDVDKNRRTQIHFKVNTFPTLVIVKNGEEVDRIVGYFPREDIKAALEKHLNIAGKSERSQQEEKKTL